MPNYFKLIATITELAQISASPSRVLDAVQEWANTGSKPAANLEPAAPKPQPAAAVYSYVGTNFPEWLASLFDKLLPKLAKPTQQETQAIYDAAKADPELVAALVELLKWRIDNGRLTNTSRVAGLMTRMLREDDHAEIKRKGNQIADNRVKAEKLEQPQVTNPVSQPPKPHYKQPVAPQPETPKAQAKPAMADPIDALMSQMGDSTPENVAKLQAAYTAFLAKQKKAQPEPQPEPALEDYDADPPIE